MGRREHWEAVYHEKPDARLSWLQERPEVALTAIGGISPRPASAIDVGGGQSCLAGELLRIGVPRVAVLDISAAGIARARERLGEAAGRVEWIEADVVAEPAPEIGFFDLWHDRAVFHFLTDASERRRYSELAARTVTKGGHLLIATFAPTGPERCSGLAVERRDAAGLAREFEGGFERVWNGAEAHRTPWGAVQDFTWVMFRRR